MQRDIGPLGPWNYVSGNSIAVGVPPSSVAPISTTCPRRVIRLKVAASSFPCSLLNDHISARTALNTQTHSEYYQYASS